MEKRAYFASELMSRRICGKDVDFSISEITPKKVCGNNVDFSTIKITSKIVRGNNVNSSISEITSKKYVKMTCKFVEIWPSIGLKWVKSVPEMTPTSCLLS